MRFNEILQIVDSAGTLVLAFVAFVVWRIKTNDLPHIYDEMKYLGERMSRQEGREDERDRLAL